MHSIRSLTVGIASMLLAACEVSGNPDDTSRFGRVAEALSAQWNVPFLSQKSYPGIKGSACAPTSLAMVLRFFFPACGIDVPEIYHAGMQSYGFHGKATCYRNLSWASGDPGSTAIPSGCAGYTATGCAGLSSQDAIVGYLARNWNTAATVISTIDGVYSAIQKGPLLGRTWGHGNAAKQWGHWVVVTGINDNGTATRTDDTIYINDPFSPWFAGDTGGEQKALSYSTFFVKGKYGAPWFRSALAVTPNEDAATRARTVLVDTGHNSVSGNASKHTFQLDDPGAVSGSSPVWKAYYAGTGGDWFYPTVGGRKARWTPSLPDAGLYQIAPVVRGDTVSGAVTYRVYDPAGNEIYSTSVNQYRSTPGWLTAPIATLALSPGSYVRATDIPANTNVDAMRFVWKGYGGMSCKYACVSYGYAPGQCYGGWSCSCSTGCLAPTGCSASTMCGG